MDSRAKCRNSSALFWLVVRYLEGPSAGLEDLSRRRKGKEEGFSGVPGQLTGLFLAPTRLGHRGNRNMPPF